MSILRRNRQKEHAQKSKEVDEAYVKEINEVGEKHSRALVAFLQVTEGGVTPMMKVVAVEKKEIE